MTEDRSIKLMTYNLKFASPSFEPSWEVRREMQVDLIRQYRPDVIGTQEGLKEQIDWILSKGHVDVLKYEIVDFNFAEV